MKRNYYKALCLIILLFVGFLGFSQIQRLATTTTEVWGPTELCTLTPTTEGSGYRLLRSEFIQSRMSSREEPCTTFIITYNSAFQLADAPREAFDFAASIWANLISSPVPIRIRANYQSFGPGNTNTIGSASNGGFFTVAGQPENIAYNSALAESILGSEIQGTTQSVDITINMNRDFILFI